MLFRQVKRKKCILIQGLLSLKLGIQRRKQPVICFLQKCFLIKLRVLAVFYAGNFAEKRTKREQQVKSKKRNSAYRRRNGSADRQCWTYSRQRRSARFEHGLAGLLRADQNVQRRPDDARFRWNCHRLSLRRQRQSKYIGRECRRCQERLQ